MPKKRRNTKKPRGTGSRFDVLSKGKTIGRGNMNLTEATYARELDIRKAAGEIVAWWFEPLSVRLSSPPMGQPARYTPDFMVLYPDGLTEIIDVKGTGIDNEASLVRLKCAAELFPLWRWRLVKKRTKRQGGGWKITEV